MKKQSIRKLVIPVAGMGTRFLPATKAQPKEMMTILDKPTIQYIVEEAVRAGITDVILVTGSTKRAIEDHFDHNLFLEKELLKAGKKAAYEAIRQPAEMANFIYLRQKGRHGTGTPILNAREVIGNEPFAVVFGDDIWHCPKKSQLQQLIEVYEKYHDPVLTAYFTDNEGTKKYGIIEGTEVGAGVYQVNKVLEKPGPQGTKSRLASISGYILTPDIFDELERLKNKTPKNKEFYLTFAMAELMKKRPFYAKLIDGDYHDIGDKLTWLMANIDFGLRDKEVGPGLKKFLKQKVK